MRRLILKTEFSLGDVVMMTAAVRDLHRCYPGEFATDVRTHFPDVWENNPYLTCLSEKDPTVEVIECRYPLINFANERPYHCLQGYIEFLNETLHLRIVPTEFRGDIHLAAEEKAWASQVHELTGRDVPFWIVAAGGKHDITIKWWATTRYQQVIDHFRNKVLFVQVGEFGHHHPKLSGTLDLRGQTSIRELIRLVYHAQGCLCGVTALMHLAAAVETRSGAETRRPCVVIAGGREPVNWEAYPAHQFLHTIGALNCCSQAGCWKSRTVPLGDGEKQDKDLCILRSHSLPRCMDMITADKVIQNIQTYFKGGMASCLERGQVPAARRGIRASATNSYDLHSLNRYNAPARVRAAIRRLSKYPATYSGRGIVICGGGLRYYPCAWVCIQMLRWVGCKLPIELWYRGEEEMDQKMKALLEPLGVKCVNAQVFEKTYPRRTNGGWELKSYALIHSSFKEVLLLDADNVPVRDPTYLFDTPEYQGTGSLFWPDYSSLAQERDIWAVCGVAYQEEPEFESGQMLVHKQKCWRPLQLAFWFNDHSDFFFKYIHGDKDTFHMAWRRLEQPYAMIQRPIRALQGIMCQHDPSGRRIFQHRNMHKWSLHGINTHVPGFWHEKSCLKFLRRLQRQWDGKIHVELEGLVREGGFVFRGGTFDGGIFRDVVEKNEYELPERFSSKDVIIDIGAHIGTFSYACVQRGARRVLAFEPEIENFRIASHNLREFGRQVRIDCRAVWRSDQHCSALLYSGYPEGYTSVNTGGGTVILSHEREANHKRKEVVRSVSLDEILRRFSRVSLLKLDCEGSEWPILLTSRLLDRVQKICGEYHELETVPTMAKVSGYEAYTKKVLEEFLRSRYRNVRIQARATGSLGHFWAEN